VSRIAVLSPVSQRTGCPFGTGSDILQGILGTRLFVSRALHSAFYDATKLSDVEVDEYARLLDRPGRAGRGVLGGVCSSYFSATFDEMVRSFGRISSPLLIVWGQEDTWHPLAFGATLSAAVPGSRLETLEHAGHNVHQEQADAVNALLTSFLSAPATPAAGSP
jgi:pimeloyl-ACP methyl ester carboxylesterase